MPQIPNRLQPDTPYADTLALINDNADKTAQDLSDFGSKFSSVGGTSFTVPAGTSHTTTVDLTDTKAQYQAPLQIVPRVEVFVDNDVNDNYLLGYPNSLSADQANVFVSVWVQRRATAGKLATYEIQLHNFGASSHTYYIYVDTSYQASPTIGSYR